MGAGTESVAGAWAARWQRPVPLAVIVFVLSLCMALAVGVALTAQDLTSDPVLMGLILSTTSLGIVVPVLKERKLSVTGYGQTLLASALMSDFATLLLLSVAIAVLSKGLGYNHNGRGQFQSACPAGCT